MNGVVDGVQERRRRSIGMIFSPIGQSSVGDPGPSPNMNLKRHKTVKSIPSKYQSHFTYSEAYRSRTQNQKKTNAERQQEKRRKNLTDLRDAMLSSSQQMRPPPQTWRKAAVSGRIRGRGVGKVNRKGGRIQSHHLTRPTQKPESQKVENLSIPRTGQSWKNPTQKYSLHTPESVLDTTNMRKGVYIDLKKKKKSKGEC